MQARSTIARISRGWTRKRLIVASIVTYGAALPLVSYYVDFTAGRDGAYGYACLLMGWAMPLVLSPNFYVVEVAWYANPLLFLAWIFFLKGKRGIGAFFGLVSLAVMVSFRFQPAIPATESGALNKILGFGPGYWLWVLSGVLACSAVLVNSRSDTTQSAIGASRPSG